MKSILRVSHRSYHRLKNTCSMLHNVIWSLKCQKCIFSQSETFDFSGGACPWTSPLGGDKQTSLPLCGMQIFLASYPPVIYDYPADKIFRYIPVIACPRLSQLAPRLLLHFAPSTRFKYFASYKSVEKGDCENRVFHID